MKKIKLHRIRFCTFLIGVFLSSNCIVANNPAYLARQQAYIDSALNHFNSNAITIQAYAGAQVDTASINQIIASFPYSGTNDFSFEMLVRVLYFAPGDYDSTILPVMRNMHYWINNDDTLDCYWSENHMIQWMSTHWLLHERYGIPVDSNLRKRLIHFLQMKLSYNYYEFFSTTYNPYALCGLLNLSDFAQDTTIRNLSSQAAQLLMKDMLLLMNDKGELYPTAGRNYPADYESLYGSDINSILWMLTGKGPVPNGATHAGGFLATSNIFTDSVVQSWEPMLDTTFTMGSQTLDQAYAYNSSLDSVDRIVFQWSAGGYFNPQFALESFNLITDSSLWRNIVFQQFDALKGLPASTIPSLSQALYSASYSSLLYNDTIVAFKHNSVTLSSVQDYWPGYWGYQQYPCVAGIDTTAVYTASGLVDSIWDNRSHSNGNDDLPYVKQVKNVALEMYWPLPKSPILTASDPSVSLHWNNRDFTEIRQDSLWLLGRIENNYIGVRRSCISQINGLWACYTTSPPGQSWVIIVGDSAIYNGFNNFQAIIDSSKFTEQWYYDTSGNQEMYYAQIIIDGDTINHLWGRDSTRVNGIRTIAPDTYAITVYPNPAGNILNISIGDYVEGEKIEIYNLFGQMIYSQGITDKLTLVDLAQWANGVYALKVSSAFGHLSTRLFIVSH